MTIGAYNTHTLMGVVEKLQTPTQFWLQLAFPSVQTFDTEYIDFDIVDKGRRMAPFVAPNVAGKPMKAKGFDTRRFKPAYVKPKHPFEPGRVIKRQAGEMYTGSLTPEQRRNAIITDIFREQREMIERRWEWMAAQAVQHGQVVISGEDYPEVTLAFGRAAGQTITLSGTNLWTDTTNAKPLTNLETWLQGTQRLAARPIQDLVFGVTAWDAFVNHPQTQKALETRRGSEFKTEMVLALGNSETAAYKGMLPNGPRLWVYSDYYEDNAGATVEMIDPTHVIGVGNVGGTRCYGAILDARAGYASVPLFPKQWEENDPSVEMLMSQSAPLMVPTVPNASFRAKVA